ncbi:hypothetical protein [Edaphobacter bradus]|uniref:hypothetical protein n=1 Tax=Edaphobacter bradus TaxID=2259016 RepID=UPI0021E0A741|nr:hypothetical protein [Edaphobacter bradus]
MKRNESCVSVSARLILFLLFAFCGFAIAQGTSPAPSDRVAVNMGETPWQFLLNRDPANAQDPSFDDSRWQTACVPYSAYQMTMFINEESGGEGELGGGINWYRKHFTSIPSTPTAR